MSGSDRRVYRGRRKVELARELGLSPAAVGQYEGGRARPSPAVLASLALRIGFDPAFFKRGRPRAHVAEGQAHFWSLRTTSCDAPCGFGSERAGSQG